jgi:hypothetical protein
MSTLNYSSGEVKRRKLPSTAKIKQIKAKTILLIVDVKLLRCFFDDVDKENCRIQQPK